MNFNIPTHSNKRILHFLLLPLYLSVFYLMCCESTDSDVFFAYPIHNHTEFADVSMIIKNSFFCGNFGCSIFFYFHTFFLFYRRQQVKLTIYLILDIIFVVFIIFFVLVVDNKCNVL